MCDVDGGEGREGREIVVFNFAFCFTQVEQRRVGRKWESKAGDTIIMSNKEAENLQ